MSEPIKQFMAHTDLLRRSMEKHGRGAMMQSELMHIVAADHIIELEATIKRVKELKPQMVRLDPDFLVIMFDDLVAALEKPE